jgi:hypothetical protein
MGAADLRSRFDAVDRYFTLGRKPVGLGTERAQDPHDPGPLVRKLRIWALASAAYLGMSRTNSAHGRREHQQAQPTGARLHQPPVYTSKEQAPGRVTRRRRDGIGFQAMRTTVFVIAIAAACRTTDQPTQIAHPVAPSKPGSTTPSASGHWWCTTADNQTTGLCDRDQRECEATRFQMTARGWPHGPCLPATAAACFRFAVADHVGLGCSPTLALCQAQRDYARDSTPSAQLRSECELME